METIPDEILLKILNNLRQDELVTAIEVSPTFARISSDSSLWKAISLTWNSPFPFHKYELAKIVKDVLGKETIHYKPIFLKHDFLFSCGSQVCTEFIVGRLDLLQAEHKGARGVDISV